MSPDTLAHPRQSRLKFTPNRLCLLGIALLLAPVLANAQTTVNIHAIQTDLPNSPYMGDPVTTEGIVIATLADGFYIENSSANSDCTGGGTLNCWDNDTATAEGIFVYTGSSVPSLAVVGNLLEVTGSVAISNSSADTEAQGTELVLASTPTLISTGNSIPSAVPSDALASAVTGAFGQWLDFEGMRIDVSSLLVTAGTSGTTIQSTQTVTSNGQFWGVLADTSRPFRATGISELETVPSTAPSTVSRWTGNPSLLFIDSAIRGGTALNVSAGQTVTDLIGVVDYHESALGYTGVLLDPSSGYGTVSGTAAGTSASTAATGQITIVTQDLDQLFDTATVSSTAYTRRIAKTALAIVNFENSPDIVAVQGAGSLAALSALATKINSDGGPAYTSYWFSGNDSTGLANGFLIDSSKVDVVSLEQAGKSATYTTSSGATATLFDRPPLVLHAGIPRTGTTDYFLTVIDSELLDRTNIDSTTLGPDVRNRREAQAAYLASLIQTYQSAGEHVLAAGDYHAFEFSDGFLDAIGEIDGDPVSSSLVTLASTSGLTNPDLDNLTTTAISTSRYTYVENGSAEEPDHILVTSDLASIVTIDYARFAADFPLIDLNDSTTALGASNHDGVIAYLTIPYLTTLTLTSSLNPSYYGESVTFTAKATSSTGTPTGTVIFYDGSTELGSETLASGSTTYTTSTLAVGSHTIKAVYGGDSSHESATASLVQVVEAALTSTNTLTCSPNPAAYGATVTCTATVTGSSTTPTGTVTFYDGTTELGTATLSDGVAAYSTSTLTVGTHAIQAVYAGAAPYSASTSNTVDEVITSNFAVSASPTTKTVYTGEAASYTVTVTADTGFTLDVALTCSGAAANSTCTVTPSTVTGGSGTAKLVVQTTAPSATTTASIVPGGNRALGLVAGALLLLMSLRVRRARAMFPVLLLALAIAAITGCCKSSTASGGTTPGSYTVTVTGTAQDGSITLTHSATVTVVVKSLF